MGRMRRGKRLAAASCVVLMVAVLAAAALTGCGGDGTEASGASSGTHAVTDLMGRDASARFRFIMERAEEAEELDV